MRNKAKFPLELRNAHLATGRGRQILASCNTVAAAFALADMFYKLSPMFDLSCVTQPYVNFC